MALLTNDRHGKPSMCDGAVLRSPVQSAKEKSRVAGLPVSAVALLLVSAALSLLRSHYKLLSGDEFLVLWTDDVATIGQVLRTQLSYPISLDPMVYHSLAHAGVWLFGAGTFALRWPSILGFLVMQICLFLLVDRIAGERAAIFAAAFPTLTHVFTYTAVGRPYGLMLGLYGLTMLSWQTAARRESGRGFALVTLAISIILTINSHFYGMLVLIPVCAAELLRTVKRRRLDLPVVASLLIGAAAIGLVVPFAKAVAEYRNHYYNIGDVPLSLIIRPYPMLLSGPRYMTVGTVLFLALVVAAVFGAVRQKARGELVVPAAEAMLLFTLAALPLFGFLLARFATHSMEERYVFDAIIGLVALIAIGLEPFFRDDRTFKVGMVVLFVAIVGLNGALLRSDRGKGRAELAALRVDPQMKASLLQGSDGRIYIHDDFQYFFDKFYEPDQELRLRLALVYSSPQDMLYYQSDTGSIQARHLRNFADDTIVDYESLSRQPGDHIFLTYDLNGDWILKALIASNAQIHPLGTALGTDVVCARFRTGNPGF